MTVMRQDRPWLGEVGGIHLRDMLGCHAKELLFHIRKERNVFHKVLIGRER